MYAHVLQLARKPLLDAMVVDVHNGPRVPCAASVWQIASPMPEAPPVTTATRFGATSSPRRMASIYS